MVDAVARRHFHMDMGLTGKWSLTSTRDEYIGGQFTRVAAREPGRRSRQAIRPDHHFAGLQKSPLLIDTERAAKFAGAFGVRDITEAVDHNGKFTLEHLGRNRSV